MPRRSASYSIHPPKFERRRRPIHHLSLTFLFASLLPIFRLGFSFSPSLPTTASSSYLPKSLVNEGRNKLKRSKRSDGQLSFLDWRTPSQLQCQLLGMNCARPIDFRFSFQDFCRRGGETDIHKDGWGVSYYQQGGVIRQFHDTEPASSSALAGYLQQDPSSIQTPNLMGHIRYATQGEVNAANVHPFCREMWGIPWCFCHNGEVPKFSNLRKDELLPHLTALWTKDDRRRMKESSPPVYYQPNGTTDSEAAFCAILNALRWKFQTLPSMPILYEAIQTLCQEIVAEDEENTILNFLMTCGPHTQWVYSWPGQRPGSSVWNGLYYTIQAGAGDETELSPSPSPKNRHRMVDPAFSVDFEEDQKGNDYVSVIATKPLTDDQDWIEMTRGELKVFDRGLPWQTPYELFQIELLGRGLDSQVLNRPCLEEDMKHYNLDPSHFQGQHI